MAKTNHKKKMKKMGRSRMRRAVMGTLSAILMISAIIVALVPIPESRADSDPTDLIAAATANPDTYIPAYTNTGNYPVYASGDGNFRAAYGSNGGSMTGVLYIMIRIMSLPEQRWRSRMRCLPFYTIKIQAVILRLTTEESSYSIRHRKQQMLCMTKTVPW